MTKATALTNRFLARCGELWPDTVRLERTGAGAGVGMADVHRAVAYLDTGNIKAAKEAFSRPVTFGIKGRADLTGFLLRNVNGEKIPHALSVEIKASGDAISATQAEYHQYLRDFHVILIVVRDLDQGIRDLQKYAGPGEKK